ncbi:MAG: AMP-binding protein [Candidatus Nanopelagicales bacterium]
MAARELTRLTVEPGPDGVLGLAAELPAALNGEGPALAPFPAGPPEYVDRILAAVRPDDPSAPLEDDDVAVVVATSGSMGEPRGVLLPGSALIASAKATDTRLGGPSRWVMALPAHHVAGLQVLVRAHLSGIPPIPLDSVGGAGHFSAQEFANATRAARAIADSDGAQLRTALVPTQLARIVEMGPAAADALGAYDTILIGGAAAAYGLIARAMSLGARIVTTYGMTETAGGCVYDGTPLAGVAVRIVDADEAGVGRIELAGPTVARGYRLRPELTEASFAAGVHRTSDRGRIDSHNRLVVVGRVDDVVQVGGINVSVAAVEAAVQEHPMVAEAAIVATPDDQWGSKIIAFVVANRLESLNDEQLMDSIIERAANALGAESRPRHVVLMDSLPTLPTGKIDREQLRTLAARS